MKTIKPSKADKQQALTQTLMASDLDKSPTKDMKDVKGKEYKMGMEMEGEEHKDIAHGDVGIIHKIVMAHLKENPKYYSMLEEMEEGEEEEKE